MTTAVKLSELINGNSSQIVVPSGGINFGTDTDGSGTVTGGVLDDYEEGTWTPTYYLNNVLQAYTPDAQGCRYVKIGRLVYLEFWTGWGAYGFTAFPNGSSDPFQIGGIPFNPPVTNFSVSNMGQAKAQGGASSNFGLYITDNLRLSFASTTGNHGTWTYPSGTLAAISISSSSTPAISGSIIYYV